MSTQEKLNEAIIDATRWHADQLDKGGHPYIFHPLSVMLRVANRTPFTLACRYDALIAAVLHDVVEDCNVLLAQIRCDYGEGVAELIDALTRREGEGYSNYIRRVKLNPIATLIKMADLQENMRPDRWRPELDGLIPRYESAMKILREETNKS